MPMRLGPTELILVLIIVIIIFGVGRVGKIGGELGNAIRQFREGLGANKGDEEKKAEAPAPEEKKS